MPSGPPISIPVRLRNEAAVAAGRELSSQLRASLKPLAIAAAGVALAYVGISKAIKGAMAIARESIRLSNIQEEAERKLIDAARSRGEFTDDQFSALQKLNAEVQRATGIGDEEQLALQASLSLMVVKTEALAKATRATIGLAEAIGGDLKSAGRIVARTLAGNTQSLRRYGIQAKTAAGAMDILQQNFIVASGRSKTFAGRTKILGAAYGDLLEQFGKSVTQVPAVLLGLGAMTEAVEALTDAFSGSEGRTAINSFVSLMLESSADMIDATLGVIKAIRDAREFIHGAEVVTVESLDPITHRTASEFEAEIEAIKTRAAQSRSGIIGEADLAALRKLRAEYDAFLEHIKSTGGVGISSKDINRDADLSGAQAAADRLRDIGVKARTAATSGPAGVIAGGPPPGGKGKGKGKGDDDAQVRAFEQHQAIVSATADLREQELDAKAQFNSSFADLDTMRLIAQREALDEQQAQQKAHNDAIADLGAQAAQMAGQGVASTLAGMAAAIGSGSGDILAVAGQLLGGMITQIGTMLVQLGTAGILAGALGTVIPALAGLTGGPLGVVAGGIAVAGGLAMIGVGSALGGAAKGGAASRPSASRGGASAGGGARPPAPRGNTSPDFSGGFRDFGGGESGGGGRTIVVNFAAALPGSERRIARELTRIMKTGDLTIA